MNLSFTDLFGSRPEGQEDEQLDRDSESGEQSDYQRDETGEHYLSEYRDRNVGEPDNQDSNMESEKVDRFSHKGHFYAHDNHDRFDRPPAQKS